MHHAPAKTSPSLVARGPVPREAPARRWYYGAAPGQQPLRAALLVSSLLLLALVGCSQEMDEQPRLEVYETSEFFEDGLAMRPPVEGTVPRGGLRLDVHFFEGKVGGQLATSWPDDITIDRAFVERGRERYDAFCSMCHGLAGYGDGTVVARGFPAPPSYHIDRLREVPHGHIYDVITNGLGRMPRLSDRITPRDRWAIVAYLRAMQIGQHVEVDDRLRAEVERATAVEKSPGDGKGRPHE